MWSRGPRQGFDLHTRHDDERRALPLYDDVDSIGKYSQVILIVLFFQ